MPSLNVGDLCWAPITRKGPFWPCQVRAVPPWIQPLATPDKAFVYFFGEQQSGLVRKRCLLPFVEGFERSTGACSSARFMEALDDMEEYLATNAGDGRIARRPPSEGKKRKPTNMMTMTTGGTATEANSKNSRRKS